MESRFLESLRRKEAQCKNYQVQAESFRRDNDYRPSEDQCRLLQMAADLEFEMSQVTMGEERAHHEREKNRLDYEIMKIQKELKGGKLPPKDQKEEGEKSKDEENMDRLARGWYKDAPSHSFEDVSGMSDLKAKLQECITDSRAELLMDYLEIPRLNSYFFVGPPGCGKTYIIEAFAHELLQQDYKYISLQGSDIISRYVGDAEKIVTRLFEEADANAPCIVFIDEIDSVCKNRSLPNLPEYAANITTSFLTGYNRIHSLDSEVIFIGATNYPDRVDSAMLDRVEVIRIPLPDEEARKSAFEKHFENIIMLEEITYAEMAQLTEGYNYRDIDRIASAIKHSVFKLCMELFKNESSSVEALRNGKYKLTKSLFEDAMEKVQPSPKDDILKALDDWENMYRKMKE